MDDASSGLPLSVDNTIPKASMSSKKPKVGRVLRSRKMGIYCVDDEDEVADIKGDDETVKETRRKTLKAKIKKRKTNLNMCPLS